MPIQKDFQMYSIQHSTRGFSIYQALEPVNLIRTNRQGLLKEMIQGGKLSVCGDYGAHLMMFAIKHGRFEMFSTLVNQAALEGRRGSFPEQMLEASDVNGDTLLHYIARYADDRDFQVCHNVPASADVVHQFFAYAVGLDEKHWQAKNMGDYTPLDLANDLGKHHLVALMQIYAGRIDENSDIKDESGFASR